MATLDLQADGPLPPALIREDAVWARDSAG
jgi:hypothetical protein